MLVSSTLRVMNTLILVTANFLASSAIIAITLCYVASAPSGALASPEQSVKYFFNLIFIVVDSSLRAAFHASMISASFVAGHLVWYPQFETMIHTSCHYVE